MQRMQITQLARQRCTLVLLQHMRVQWPKRSLMPSLRCAAADLAGSLLTSLGAPRSQVLIGCVAGVLLIRR
jgi:hypothetical protein